MKNQFMRLLVHIGIVAAGVCLILGLPLFRAGFFARLLNADADAVSSATVILDQPSGEYVIYLNRAMHPDEEKLQEWIRFFSGEEISYIFEDIACSVAEGDTGALDLARSFQSRLPENQMKVTTENATLLLSRADSGRFDILIVSKEFAETYQADTAAKEEVERMVLISEEGDES